MNTKTASQSTFLTVQMDYTTQPFGDTGPSDIDLLHSSLTQYRTFIVNRLNKHRAKMDPEEIEEEENSISCLKDMLFDLQSNLIDADQQRAKRFLVITSPAQS